MSDDAPASPDLELPVAMYVAPADTAARVEHIAAMMRTGRWRRGKSAKALARAWELSVSRVEDHSAEAWRIVCREANDADAARPTIAGTLATAMTEAYQAREYGSLAKLADTYSRVVGARAPEVRAEVPLTEEQARAKYKEITGKDWGT